MKELLERILNHESLTRKETCDILVGITRGMYSNEQLTALLTGIQMRGITVDELLGFRDGILATGVPAVLDCDRYIDVVGTVYLHSSAVGNTRNTVCSYPGLWQHPPTNNT